MTVYSKKRFFSCVEGEKICVHQKICFQIPKYLTVCIPIFIPRDDCTGYVLLIQYYVADCISGITNYYFSRRFFNLLYIPTLGTLAEYFTPV